jgi:hypothetical protein
VKSLLERHLIRIAGQREVPGRPMLYGTTRRFLEVFGLERLKDLPTLREIDELAREQGLLDKAGEGSDDDASQFQQFSSQCLRSFKVENHGNTSKVIELRITPRSAKLNFKCPGSTIPCQVFSNSSTAVIHLTKLDPTIDDWGDFEWSFTVRDKQASTYVSITNTTNNYQAITNDASPPSTGGAAATWYDNAGDATYSAAEKACPACTYLNPATASSCGICLANL